MSSTILSIQCKCPVRICVISQHYFVKIFAGQVTKLQMFSLGVRRIPWKTFGTVRRFIATNSARLVVVPAGMGSVGSRTNLHTTPSAGGKRTSGGGDPEGTPSKMNPADKAELVKKLTPLQYHVTQEAGTERPFTGKYNKCYDRGTYVCVVCSQELFSSDTKYDSGCGWPAFNDVLDKGKVTLHADASLAGRVRTEVRCSKCGAHMGHVFEDGPPPTRKRYCINSASIEFLEAGTERRDPPSS